MLRTQLSWPTSGTFAPVPGWGQFPPLERVADDFALMARHGITIVNAPGTVDAGYRGEIKVSLINLDPTEPITLKRGDRIAQLVIQEFVSARFVEVDELPDSVRGAGGHGSTGGF